MLETLFHYPEIILLIAIIVLGFFVLKQRQQHATTNTLTENNPSKETKPVAATVITSKDLRAIAGNDIISTQLDLARAYLEVGKKKLAKQMLEHAKKHGDVHQQQKAAELLQQL